jgi:hypothetical protein
MSLDALNNNTVVAIVVLACIVAGSVLFAISWIPGLRSHRYLGAAHRNRAGVLISLTLGGVLLGLTSIGLTLFGYSSGDAFDDDDGTDVRVLLSRFDALERCNALATDLMVDELLITRLQDQAQRDSIVVTFQIVDHRMPTDAVNIERILQRHRAAFMISGQYRTKCGDRPLQLTTKSFSLWDKVLKVQTNDSLRAEDVLSGFASAEIESRIQVLARQKRSHMEF